MNKISVKSQIRRKLKRGKLPAKAGQNSTLTAPRNPLVAIGELHCGYVSTKNNQSSKKTLFQPLPRLCLTKQR